MVICFRERCFRRVPSNIEKKVFKMFAHVVLKKKLDFAVNKKVLRSTKKILPWKKVLEHIQKEFLLHPSLKIGTFFKFIVLFHMSTIFFGYRKQQIQTKVFVDTSILKSFESSNFILLRSSCDKMTVITNNGVIGDDHRVLLILLDNYNDSSEKSFLMKSF